jgi:glycosyltransferase involved in cell wall biosynthesis
MSSVDVVIPNYNYSTWLRAAIDSVLAQEGVELRVLVVDNCSTDHSVELVGQAMADDPRVHLLEHAENMGLIASLNDGVEWVKADYTLSLSADDALTPGALRRAVSVMDKHPDVSFVYGPVLVQRDGRRAPRERRGTVSGVVRIWNSDEWLWQVAGSGHVCIRSPEVIARSSLVKEVGYQSRLPHTSDMGLCLQLAARGRIAHLRGVKQAVYREHKGSLMRTMADPIVTDLIARLDAFDNLVTQDAALLPRGPALLERACVALATEALLFAISAYERPGHVDPELTSRLLETAQSIYPQVTLLPEYRRLTEAQSLGALSPVRWARVARQEFRDGVRKVRSREFGQWPSYVSS